MSKEKLLASEPFFCCLEVLRASLFFRSWCPFFGSLFADVSFRILFADVFFRFFVCLPTDPPRDHRAGDVDADVRKDRRPRGRRGNRRHPDRFGPVPQGHEALDQGELAEKRRGAGRGGGRRTRLLVFFSALTSLVTTRRLGDKVPGREGRDVGEGSLMPVNAISFRSMPLEGLDPLSPLFRLRCFLFRAFVLCPAVCSLPLLRASIFAVVHKPSTCMWKPFQSLA